jgi:hypothetical protein
LNVLADAESSAPAVLEKLLHEPKKANTVLGGGKIEALFMEGYREYLGTSFDEMQKTYGSIENSSAAGPGIDATGRQALRDLFLARK